MNFRILVLFFYAFLAVGCSTVTEPFKRVLGVSMKGLQDARSGASKASYRCAYRECFDAVLALTKKSEDPQAIEQELDQEMVRERYFDIFRKSYKKGFMVVMGIKGQVDTTEVGIFFTHKDDDVTVIDVSSLSSAARTKVAKAVFDELDQQFTKVD